MNNTIKTLMAQHALKGIKFTDMETMIRHTHLGLDVLEETKQHLTVKVKPHCDFFAINLAKKLGLSHSIKSLKQRMRTSKFLTVVQA